MKKTFLLLIGMMMLSVSLTAQEKIPKKPKHVTYEQVTSQMSKELQLNEKQLKKVTTRNTRH